MTRRGSVVRDAIVRGVARSGPGRLRVTVGGPQLTADPAADSVPPFRSRRFDDHVQILLRPEGHSDGGDQHREPPEPVARAVTVRAHDPAAGEIELDVVVHGEGGVLGRWATTDATGVRPGDAVRFVDPGPSTTVPPADVHLLVGDETALPAIARRVAEGSGGVRVVAVVETSEAVEDPLDGGAEVVWVRRGSELRLLDAVAAVELPSTRVYAWVAGEASMVRRVRAHLRHRRGLTGGSVDTAVYWTRGSSADGQDARAVRLRELTDMMTPVAIRAASSWGIPELLLDGPLSVGQIAAACGTHPRATRSLLRWLATRGVFVESSPGSFELGELGDLLFDDELRHLLDLDGDTYVIDLSWAGLPHAVRTGAAGFPAVFGHDFYEHLAGDAHLASQFYVYLENWARAWVPEAASALAPRARGTVVDVGGGSGGLLAEVLRLNPAVHGVLVETGAAARRARQLFASSMLEDRAEVVEGSFFDGDLPVGGQLYVLAQVVHNWPDEDAVRILRRCADVVAPDGRIVLVERVPDEDHPTREQRLMDLRMLVLFGARERSRTEFAELARRAGLAVVGVHPAGSATVASAERTGSDLVDVTRRDARVLSFVELVPAREAGAAWPERGE